MEGAAGTRMAAALARARAIDPALLLLASMAFVVQVGIAVMLPLLPLFAQSLGATPFVLGLLTSAFAVTNAAGQLATGFLAERFPVRRLIAGGIGAYALANILIAGAANAAALVAFRAFAGIGGGVMIVGERLYLIQITDRARLAFANGILSAAASAGMVAGPAIGGLLAAASDLRAPFILVGLTSLVATVGALFLPQPKPRESIPPPTETPSPTAAPATVRSDRARLLVLLVAQLGFMSGFGAFITTYGPFASTRLGWSTAEIGIVFATFGLGSITLGPWLSRQADLRGRRNVGILAAIPVALFGIVYVAEAPRAVLYATTILGGAGVTTAQAAWYALLAEATQGGRRGRVFSTIAALSNLGIIVGATIAAQAWERTGDIGLGMLVAAASIASFSVVMLAHPSDRSDGPGTSPATPT